VIDLRVVTPKQMREIDKRAIEEFGIPGIILMENAALQAQKIIEKLYPSIRKVLILAGYGNNGGDGLALARLFHSSGKAAEILLFGNEYHLSPDAKRNLMIIERLQIPLVLLGNSIKEDESRNLICDCLTRAALVADALFGTGLSKPLEGHFKIAVDMVNDLHHVSARKIPIISLDIPSGGNGEKGAGFG